LMNCGRAPTMVARMMLRITGENRHVVW
jgi:hypothetical protein